MLILVLNVLIDFILKTNHTTSDFTCNIPR